MNQQTIEKLRFLRLPGFIQALTEQQENRSYHDLSFEERLALLIERESLRRENLRLTARLRAARLKVNASVDQIDFKVARGLSKPKFLELVQGTWLAARHNLIIVGPTGVGKTFIASALADHCCRQGQRVLYTKTGDIAAALEAAKADGSFKQFSAKLLKTTLLILDEWLREPLPLQHAREILDLIDERYRKASCIFVTQLPVKDWHKHIHDPTLADAILDRIVHDSLRIELSGESMRKLTSKTKNAQHQ
jgi:DNA replication protein DnaC